MNLLADECVAAEIVVRLRADGHVVQTAGDIDPGAAERGSGCLVMERSTVSAG